MASTLIKVTFCPTFVYRHVRGASLKKGFDLVFCPIRYQQSYCHTLLNPSQIYQSRCYRRSVNTANDLENQQTANSQSHLASPTTLEQQKKTEPDDQYVPPDDVGFEHYDRASKNVDRLRSKLRRLHRLDEHLQEQSPVHHSNENSTLDLKIVKHGHGQTLKTVEEDMLNIAEEVVEVEPLNSSEITAKYGLSSRQAKPPKYEKVLEAPYGFIRFDNVARRNTAILNSEMKKKDDSLKPRKTESVENVMASNLFDDQYFPRLSTEKNSSTLESDNTLLEKESNLKCDISMKTVKEPLENFFDEQYFPQSVQESIQSVREPSQNILEEQYFPKSEEKSVHIGEKKSVRYLEALSREGTSADGYSYPSLSDEEFFPDQNTQGSEPHRGDLIDRSDGKNLKNSSTNYIGNIFEEQYFSESLSEGSTKDSASVINKSVAQNLREETFKEKQSQEEEADIFSLGKQHLELQDGTNNLLVHSLKQEDMVSDQRHTKAEMPVHANEQHIIKREKHRKSLPVANTESPQSAYDMVMKMRQEKKCEHQRESPAPSSVVSPRHSKWTGKVDSMGFRILTDQTADVHNLPEDVVVKILKDSILYEDDKIIAIDKPYGLPSHGGPRVHHSVGKLLSPLAKKVGSEQGLHLVHRLDKETTGVMLLAKTPVAEKELLKMFVKRQVLKKYWLITKGLPNPTEGVIDIPMAEGLVENRTRMALRPDYTPEMKLMMKSAANGAKITAITNYKVLDSHGSAALVECQPETGVKHQIRCHMAFGLNCPVLGDHKYSHLSKMAPQKLYPDLLQRLGIRQAKVRHLAMHLHAKAVVLPEFRDGQNVFISARLPKHFVQNMKWLKLKPPKS